MTKPTIILSGVPGNMCRQIAGVAIEEKNFGLYDLASVALSADGDKGKQVEIAPGVLVTCESVGSLSELISSGKVKNPIVVDYTMPSVAMSNVKAYAEAGVPFVMGTTGFDRDEAVKLVKASKASAVISPNMGAPIVMLQTMLEVLEETFPGVLDGYTLSVTESHQAPKKDVSGTAKAFLPKLQGIGCQSTDPAIRSVREPEEQKQLGVPEEALSGHAYHWYKAVSPAGDVALEFSHCINGRRVYAEGTLKAVEFLAGKVAAGSQGEVFTMRDVLAGKIKNKA